MCWQDWRENHQRHCETLPAPRISKRSACSHLCIGNRRGNFHASPKTDPTGSASVAFAVWKNIANGRVDLRLPILQYPISRWNDYRRVFHGLFVSHRLANSFRHWHCGRSDGFGVSFAEDRMGIHNSRYPRISRRDVLASTAGGSVGVPRHQSRRKTAKVEVDAKEAE